MKKRKIAGSICIAAAVICAGISIYQYAQQKHAGESYKEVRTDVKRTEERTETPKEAAKDSKNIAIPIDFTALQAENPDVYAWIQIPGTSIDYPILQSQTDNTYYLNHALDGSEQPEGAIFTENYNTRTFEDPNTVIYGHDMKNGSMFQNLHNYEDREFFDTNRDVKIYLPDRILHYKIFAAYLYDDRHLLLSFHFEDPEVYQNYLNQIFSMRDMNAFVDTSMKVTSEDSIITLSTCYGNNEAQRYLVQAVLVSIEN